MATWSSGSEQEGEILGGAFEREVDEAEEVEEGADDSVEYHVYSELSAIRDKLHDQLQGLSLREAECQQQAASLREREERMCEMEELACQTQAGLELCIAKEVDDQLRQHTQRWQQQEEKYQAALQERGRENQRLRSSFDTLRHANETLKKQLEQLTEQNSQLEGQLTSMSGRLSNLQKRNQHLLMKQQQKELRKPPEAVGQTEKAHKPRPSNKNKDSPHFAKAQELLAVLMEWLHLVYRSHRLDADQTALVQQQCRLSLPLLSDLLPSPVPPDWQARWLAFTHWCVGHLENGKPALSSTLRRIGEELYKAGGSAHRGFLNSPDVCVRVLSALVIIQTLSQVDVLAHVFDLLQQELREHEGKECFLTYDGVNTILPFMKASQKALCSHVVDIYLQLSVESGLLPCFLEACSTLGWLSSAASLLKEATDNGLLEKLSIILQRLSKIRSNRRLFDRCQLPQLIQRLLQRPAAVSDPGNPFLSLNLQSILLNLTSKH